MKASVFIERGIKGWGRTAGGTNFEHVVLLAFLLQALFGIVGLLIVAFALDGGVSKL